MIGKLFSLRKILVSEKSRWQQYVPVLYAFYFAMLLIPVRFICLFYERAMNRWSFSILICSMDLIVKVYEEVHLFILEMW